MNVYMRHVIFIFGIVVLSVNTHAQINDEIQTRSTFECISIYYNQDDRGDCNLKYRPKGDPSWRDALDLVYDAKEKQYRGSIVGLQSNHEYEIQLQCGDAKITTTSRTMNESFSIGKTTVLNNGVLHETIEIKESGSVDGYHLVTVPENGKTTLDVLNTEDFNIRIDADYVIVRGVEMKNAARHGINIEKNRQHIVIEDCRITFWGRIGGSQSFGNEGNMDSAIYAQTGAGNLVIQRNLIENPRGGSNDWDTGHPSGPQAISMKNSSGGNIIRYNEIRSTEGHKFNDAIGGSSNYSFEGSPNCDSDIYGNIITHVWDDGIESEGANRNVRIWGNYIAHTYQHIATACTSKGPLYIFRNIFAESQRTSTDTLGGSMIKVGERDEFGGGRKFVFHNTALQPNGAFDVFSGHVNPNTVTRNNIFDCPGRLTSSREVDVPGDYDYDLFTGRERGLARERHGYRAKPSYIHSYALEYYPASTTTKIEWGKVPVDMGEKTVTLTDPVVTIPNPVIDGGVKIPNFNDAFVGDAPDLGAFEMGRPPLKFGRRAQDGIKWAPWEIH